jgi:hypothetical protein
VAERTNAPVLKTGGRLRRPVGSNPTPSVVGLKLNPGSPAALCACAPAAGRLRRRGFRVVWRGPAAPDVESAAEDPDRGNARCQVAVGPRCPSGLGSHSFGFEVSIGTLKPHHARCRPDHTALVVGRPRPSDSCVRRETGSIT